MNDGLVQAAIVQTASVPLAVSVGIERAVTAAGEAIDAGAALVAFGETFLGGYPIWLDEAPGAALWDHPGTRALHAILLDQAVRVGDPRFEPLQALVDASAALVSIGAHLRVRNSLYNAQLLFRPGAPPMIHRKLVPTHGERLIWARGDGSSLTIHDAPWGPVGQLMCWEHWMPLARAAMHHLGEAVHIAAWPGVREMYQVASRHYAFEGRCFVLAAGTVMHRDDLIEGLALAGGNDDARALILTMPDRQLQRGGSAIIAPDGRILAAAGDQPERLMAPLALGEIGAALTALDTDGHYARPDIFELRVDRRVQAGVRDAIPDNDG